MLHLVADGLGVEERRLTSGVEDVEALEIIAGEAHARVVLRERLHDRIAHATRLPHIRRKRMDSLLHVPPRVCAERPLLDSFTRSNALVV